MAEYANSIYVHARTPSRFAHPRCAKFKWTALAVRIKSHSGQLLQARARGYGAMAARLTPDQKVGSSNLSGLISPSVGGLLLARSQSGRGLGATILGIEHVGLSRRGQLFAHTPA